MWINTSSCRQRFILRNAVQTRARPFCSVHVSSILRTMRRRSLGARGFEIKFSSFSRMPFYG